MIESYSFGRIVINGREFSSDVIIYPDGRVEGSWWRKSGHILSTHDILDLIESTPEVIIAGTGASGLMKPDGELKKYLLEEGILFIALPCREAIERYNELAGKKKVGACFHLTC
ncbi:MAG: hypothetical protein KAJ60_02805 [Desulfobulbaceae bacterium]|nr:hypothetical protein [Desulfobulbaceae bacterium]